MKNSEELCARGIITGDVLVEDNAILEVRGILNGNMLIAGGEVRLYGIINGKAVNKGGILLHYGIINGELIEAGGTTKMHPNAIIRDPNNK